MNSLCEDLICSILRFCDAKTSYKLSMCSKYIYECTKKGGFARYLCYDYPKCDYNIFMKRYLRHHNSIETFVIRCTNNPFYWLPKWSRNIHFEYCTIRDAINPKRVVETESITILTVMHHWKITIAWENFPNLQKLVVKGYALNFEGIEKCTKLKNIIYLPLEGP